MKNKSRVRTPLVYWLLSALALPQASLAAPLVLSTAPPGSAYKKPAPNVIVSVDDSSSMGTAGMQILRDALFDTFSQANVPDGSIRLEVACSDGLPGYMITFSDPGTAKEATGCALTAGCTLPTNKKKG